MKTLLKELNKELLKAHKKVHLSKVKNELDRLKACLQYEKIQLIKKRQPFEHITRQLEDLEKNGLKIPPMQTTEVRTFLTESRDKNNLQNVVHFLRSQRTYNELLERYNPGLRMSSEDNVRKTAARVGLQIPE